VTRLRSRDIAGIREHLGRYDAELKAKTGCSLKNLACRAAGLDPSAFVRRAGAASIGVVPLTAGEGIIAGFCEAVAGIAGYLGCRSFVTRGSDAAGLAEAVENKAHVLMLADDNCFAAIDLGSRQVIHNAGATGRGFAQAMELLAGGVRNRAVLIIGCGPVGRAAALWLGRRAARLWLYDIAPRRCRDLAAALASRLPDAKVHIIRRLGAALRDCRLIVDASPAEGIIKAEHITPSTRISAPGVPAGVTDRARARLADRLVHDPLQIGVATMIAEVVKLQQGRAAR